MEFAKGLVPYVVGIAVTAATYFGAMWAADWLDRERSNG